MGWTRLDHRTADRLAGGAVTPEDAPPGWTGVAELLQAALSSAPAELEPVREAATVASMRAILLGHPVPVTPTGRKQVLAKVLTIKVAALSGAVVLGGGVAAAATGSLPAPAQDAVSSALSHVGISVPASDSSTTGSGGSSTTDSTGSTTSGTSPSGTSTSGTTSGTTTSGTTTSGTGTGSDGTGSTAVGTTPTGSTSATGTDDGPGSDDNHGLCTAQAAHHR